MPPAAPNIMFYILQLFILKVFGFTLSFGDAANVNRQAGPTKRRIEEMLKYFHIDNFEMLRIIMAATGAIISGSSVLTVINEGEFLPNDLDFFVLSDGISLLLVFLMGLGYHLAHGGPGIPVPPYEQTGRVVFTLYHRLSGRKINVVIPYDDHLITAISSFHSTPVMNYISWYGVVSLYHHWTSKSVGFIVRAGDGEGRCIGKYRERGYEMHEGFGEMKRRLVVKGGDPASDKSPVCIKARRYLHDGYSHLIAFDNLPDDLAAYEENITWVLPVSCDHCNGA